MAIVSCPECGKKLKIADTSVGRKVKCTAGHVFVAEANGPPASSPPSPSGRGAGGEGMPAKVIVACSECSAKLKVATTSLGKKMKCPKCTGVFVAALEDEAPPMPVKKKAPPPVAEDDDLFNAAQDEVEAETKPKAKKRFDDDDEDEPMPKPKAKKKFDDTDEDEPAPKAKTKKKFDDDEDEPAPKAKTKKKFDDRDEDEPAPKARAKKKFDDDEDDEPMPKGKPAKPTGVPTESAEKPVYPSRLGPNILVAMLLVIYVALFAAVFMDIDLARMLGLPVAKGIKPKKKLPFVVPENKDDGKDKNVNDDGKDKDGKDKDVIDQNAKDKDDQGKDGKDKNTKEKGKKTAAAAKLNGIWIVESSEEKGVPRKHLIGDVFIFADGKLKASKEKETTYTVDESKNPMWLDVVIPDVATMHAIVKMEGGKLYMAAPSFGLDDKPGPRPTAFDSKNGMLMVFKRGTQDDIKKRPIGNGLAPRDALSQNNLKQIGLAMIVFHDFKKHLPPSASHDPTGKPLLSWRVAILPFIEQEALHKEFDLTKPWDDPHNKKLIAKMPKLYVVPGTDGKGGKTHYRALVGPGTVLEPRKAPDGRMTGRKLAALKDGSSNCIVVVEATDAIEWTRPDDLPYNPKGPLPKFGVVPGGFNVLFADAHTEWVPANVSESLLRPYLTCDNGIKRQPLGGKN